MSAPGACSSASPGKRALSVMVRRRCVRFVRFVIDPGYAHVIPVTNGVKTLWCNAAKESGVVEGLGVAGLHSCYRAC